MDWKQIFISYAMPDKDIALTIAVSLKRIELKPFLAEDVRNVGGDILEKVKKGIANSNCFVPILTKDSIASQWVNQEIGFAIALDKFKDEIGDAPKMFPIVERGLSFKGFINPYNMEYVAFENNLSEITYQLITALRRYIDRNLTILEKLHVSCEKCGNDFTIPIPTQEAIDQSIQRKDRIIAYHKPCDHGNLIHPKTLDVIKSKNT